MISLVLLFVVVAVVFTYYVITINPKEEPKERVIARARVDIQWVTDNEFFVEVPLDKDLTTVMGDTIDLLQAFGEEVLSAGCRKGEFRIKLIMREGTSSAIQGAVTNAIEGLTIGSPS